MNNEKMSSGKGPTLVKTTLLPGQEQVTVVASLPTNPSCDVPIEQVRISDLLLTFSLLLGKIPLCRPKIIPIRRDISM